MHIINGFPKGLASELNYISLGNFDGVHIGHQQLIKKMLKDAQKDGANSIVLTFDPHPKELLEPTKPYKLINSVDTKIKLISKLGIDYLVFLPFNTRMAELSSEEFLKEILMNFFNPAQIYVGYNYSFGRGGIGTPELLKRYGKQMGFNVKIISPILINNEPVSSTYIRELIEKGDILLARKCLGYWPLIEGRVVSGDKLGRKIGFPTANLKPDENLVLPHRGVYGGLVNTSEGKYPAIANIGLKPTVSDRKRIEVEIHILNFEGNLYDQFVSFSIKGKIRDEKHFSSIDNLKEQIKFDISEVESWHL